MAELSQQYRAAAEERYGKGGGSVSAVAKRGYEYAKEHPVEAASYAYVGGWGVKLAAKGITYLAKKKLPELGKAIRTKLGSKKISKKEFKEDKKLGKGAKQQAEEAKTKYEKVVTRKETVTKDIPGKKVKRKVKDKLGHDVKYTRGPNKGKPKYETVAGPKVKKITKETRARYEPTWEAVAAQQAPKLKAGAGIVAGGVLAKSLLTGKPTTVGAAQYDDKPVIGERSDEPTLGKITTDKKKSKAWTTSGVGGTFESSEYRERDKIRKKEKVTMTSTIPQKNEINFATGKPRNNTSTVSADSVSKNKYKSVTSNYTRTKDNRGTRVESTSPKGNRKQSNAQLKRNGVVKSKTKGKKRSTSSGIPSFTEMVHEQRRIRAKRY